MSNYKQIIALSVIGYVFFLAINYLEGILISLGNILGMMFNINPKAYVFLDLIPETLLLLIWILIVFKFLKGFRWNETFNATIPRKFGVRLGMIVLTLFIILLGVRLIIENDWWPNRMNYSNPDENLVMIHASILSVLNFLEIVIIVIGFIKLINKKSATADTQISK